MGTVTIKRVEKKLRALGLIPVSEDPPSHLNRAWKHADDERPDPELIRVPRVQKLDKEVADRILARAAGVVLR